MLLDDINNDAHDLSAANSAKSPLPAHLKQQQLSGLFSNFFPDLRFQRKSLSLSLIALLGLTGGVWGMTATLTAQVAQAYTTRQTITLDRLPTESYQTLLHRAEAAARAAAQRAFTSDILVTDVAVTIVAESQGAVAPVLALEASRNEWQRLPDPRRWSTYFENARSLLGFDQPLTVQTEQPGEAIAPQPPVQADPTQTAPIPTVPSLAPAPVAPPF
jgi:hypothetical protein